ncbi:MAG TPA: hypothetical protein VD865_08415 [Stenotrophomonas sp.]|nr:hypothetical protein [Stenotrophomonas sp.]
MKTLLAAALLTSLSFPVFAGPDGTFLCSSTQPYDFLTSDTTDYRSYGIRSAQGWSHRQSTNGQLIAGQGVKALSADGLMLVPLEDGKDGWVELHKQGRVLARIHGYIHMWDLWSDGTRERFMFTIWDGVDRGDLPPLTATETQMRYIVDGDAKVLLKQPYEESTDPEDGPPPLLFSADGNTLYEEVADLASTARMFSAADLSPIGTIQAPGSALINSLAVLSADRGFAIAGNQLFHVSAGKLVPFELSQPFDARVLQVDTRSRRILVEGVNDFIVLDFSGNVLFRFADQPSVAAEQRWVSPRLAIDGSVGIFREGEPLARVLTRQSNYRESRLTPLERQDWNRVACFTPNSAALWVDDKPLLVKF